MKKTLAAFTSILLAITAISSFSQDLKARMSERLPAILELKAKGAVGEDSNGFLKLIGDAKDEKGIVASENADRKAAYEQIAKSQKTTPELVGRRRALQNAANAKPGELIQDAKGNWVKKK